MKVLVITQPAWNNQNNTGNTLSNFFSGTQFTFANLYFSGDIPNNKICHNYYQISDSDVLNHLLKHKSLGRSFCIEKENQNINKYAINTRSTELKAKKFSNFYTQLIRELMWKCTSVINNDVINWIKNFNPDCIYAPTFGNFHMLRITRQIANNFPHVPLISDISDDHYYRFSKEKNPVKFVFNKVFLRRSLLKTFQKYDLLYTMTENQQKLYQPLLNAPIKIYRKKALFLHTQNKENNPLRMVYAGGLYLGRDESLIHLIKVINKINMNNKKIVLDIYTSTSTPTHLNKLLELSPGVSLHESVDYNKLIHIYDNSDIALLLESFSPTLQEQVKLSFSTKIVDALQSGCAIFAIGPSTNAGYIYLLNNNAAVICDELTKIKHRLEECINKIQKLKQSSTLLCKQNHDKALLTKQIISDFTDLIVRKQRNLQ